MYTWGLCLCGMCLWFECVRVSVVCTYSLDVCTCAGWYAISGCWDQENQARDTLTFPNGSNDLLSFNI